jgi:hypothetical protein
MFQISDLNQIPPFWQGIVTSLVATAIGAFAVYLFRVFFSNWTVARTKYKHDWARTQELLNSPSPELKMDGFFSALARGVRYFVLGSLAWLVSDLADYLYIISDIVSLAVSVITGLIALTLFIFAGRWIYLLLARNIDIHAP